MRAEMAYCGPRGIPHSEFLSWPVDDRAKALGWMADESQKCGGCGVPAWDDHAQYEAEDYTCPVCARVENVRSRAAKSKAPGMHVRVVRTEGSDAG